MASRYKVGANGQLTDPISGRVAGFCDSAGNECMLPAILGQSGTPVILLSAGTSISATGAISGITPLIATPSGVVQVYCFAQAGLAAGLYYARFSSTSACQLYTDAAGTLTPNGITPGAYASGIGTVTLATINVPGGSMGPNGSLRASIDWTFTNSGNAKSLMTNFGGTNLFTSARTTSVCDAQLYSIRNRGAQNVQGLANSVVPGTSLGGNYKQIGVNTAVDQVWAFQVNVGATADNVILEGYTLELLPG